MKKITFCIFSLALTLNLVAQESKKTMQHQKFELTSQTIESINYSGYARCLTDENEIALSNQYPNRSTNSDFEAWLAPKIAQIKADRAAGRTNQAVFNIPVVIHIVHNGDAINVAGNATGENISDAQALSQIQVLNEDFRRLVGTPGGANTTGLAVDVELNFCIAEVDPTGGATTGIVRHNIAPYSNNVANGTGGADWETRADVEAMKAATQWDPTKYLNMWTIRAGGLPLQQGGLSGLLGYAQFPDNTPNLGGLNSTGGAANTDGVVAGFDAMGTIAEDDGSFILNATYNLGRTMTHEVGHWLGLRHIWGDGPQTGSCGVDDFCADTPNAAQPNYNCVLNNNSCPSDANVDQVQNYMDYTNDACMDTFTQDQKDRIQAVMGASPRRVELNSSTACTITPNAYIATVLPQNIEEGSDCAFQDYTIDILMSTGGSSASTITLVNTGTATENEDFMLMNNSVSFAAGSTTPSNAVTLRVFNDSFVEADETIELTLNLTTTGDATASTSQVTSTIINDDSVVTSNGNAVIFSDGFETYTDFDITPVGGWTMLDNDGDGTYGSNTTTWTNSGYTGTFMVFNPSQTSPSLAGSIWDPNSGDKGYYCFNATGNVSGTPLNDDYIFTPQISLNGTNSELKFFAKSITDQYGLERFQVGVSTTDTNPSSFTYITPSPYEQAPITWTEYTYDLSAYDGQDIYITFHVVSADAFAFMLDDVSVTADVNTLVQTDVNTATPDQVNLTAAGQAYSSDVSTGNIMLDIDNTGGFAHGCTTVAVSRDATTAGAAAVSYAGGTDVAGFVTAKTFDITTTNASSSDASTINFYFTEAEIAAWETATGNNRSALQVKKEGTNEVVPVTISAFGTDLILSASFTTGIADTYYFGSQLAFLSVNNFELASTLSIYPNPSVGVLTIKAANDNDLPSAYKVYNMLGQLITENNINNTQDLTIDTTPFSNGMYFIKISKAGNAVTFPFIKK
ncbi:hypothetical protein BFP78_01570 [Gaetbulibacter sp. 5U11]|nr:hypothetical protein BFP78_01570 [Gaetbulibacter sp. 5U11]